MRISGKPAPQTASSPVSPENAALEFLKTLKMPCRVLIAYSGGGDSTGLMVALAAALKAHPDLDVSLMAATVDHGLRPESASEARAVGAACTRLGVPHNIATWEGVKPCTGMQAAAREARYRLLGDLALSLDADLIVTAHNRDDQFETLAMRRARNPDATGGISSAVLFDRRVWVLRPFLNVAREDIRAYLTSRGVGWVDDPSNDNDLFERVRIRKSAHDGIDLPDSGARRALASKTARLLLAGTVIHSALVSVVDLSRYEPDDPAHLDAIRHLAAMMGGRTHLAGGTTTARIARFLASADSPPIAAERVVLDRRKHRLYIGRERRSLPELAIGPGSTGLWDSRFRIDNHGSEPAVIGARGDGMKGGELLTDPVRQDIPGAVRQRIEATQPMLFQGRRDSLVMQPIIAQFDRFLPLDGLDIANALAFLGGLDHFPELPTR